MRTRICILVLLICLSAVSAFARDYSKNNKGYFCDVGVAFGGTFPKGNEPKAILELFTTHGYQFSNTFSLGGGISTYLTETFNVYTQLRFNLRKLTEEKSHYTYISLRLGYSWSTWTGDSFGDDKGPIVDPRFGWSFYTKSANLRWSVFAAPSFYQFHFIPKIGLAFEF